MRRILKRRPRITLLAPREITAGRPFELTAVLDCRRPVPVRSVEIELTGESVWYTRSQYGQHRNARAIYRARARVFGGGEIPAGSRSFAARFELPSTLPGSYAGRRVRVEYAAVVRVDIPWWPDARGSFQLFVQAAPVAPASRPAVFASNAGGPEGRRPYLELSVASTEIVPGRTLALAASLANVDANRYRDLELEIVAVETMTGFLTGGSHRVPAGRFELPLSGAGEGKAIRFEVAVPDELVPGFDLERIRLEWVLEARARVALGRDPSLLVPIVVRGPGGGSQAEIAADAPPAVGSERVDLLWREIATDLGLGFADGAIAGPVGGSAVRIWREFRGRRGPAIVAEIEMPTLGVGLGLSASGRRARVVARDTLQSRRLAELLGSAPADASVIEADDRRLRCERRRAGVRKRSVTGFVGAVTELARRLDEARAALPPPPCLEPDLPRFEATARALGGRLEAAGPVIRGERGAARYELSVGWNGEDDPAELLIEVTPPAPIDARRHLRWTEGEPIPAAGELDLEELCAGASTLEITREQLLYALPYAAHDRVPARVAELLILAERLCAPASAGVYR